MDLELNHLEEKVSQLLRLSIELRNENRTLRQQVLTLHQDKQQLIEKVETSKQRLSSILSKLPENQDE